MIDLASSSLLKEINFQEKVYSVKIPTGNLGEILYNMCSHAQSSVLVKTLIVPFKGGVCQHRVFSWTVEKSSDAAINCLPAGAQKEK